MKMNSHAHFMNVAEQARLTLLGKRKGEGFWIMPEGRPFVVLCYRNNLELARKARVKENCNE
jgi:hypothetical protein